MEGLKELAIYVKLIKKYMEFRGNISFRIENFEKGNPAAITIAEKSEDGKLLSPYTLYGSVEDNILSLLDENGNDVILFYQKEQNLSDEEKEKQRIEFTKIIKEG